MSDPEVPQPERPKDVNDVVDSANAGLEAAEAARADVAATPAETTAAEAATPTADPAVDPDLAAFEAAERDHPGTFATPELNNPAFLDADPDADAKWDTTADDTTTDAAASDAAATEAFTAPAPPAANRGLHEESAMAGAAYAGASAADTRIVPSEPLASEPAPAETVIAPVQQQPIFVQAPEPPRERGNRGTAGAIGLLATLAFAVLYLAATLGVRAFEGEVTGANIADAAIAPLVTWGYWVPVVVFFLGFWLLGAFINRGRWGLWVVFGIIVGAIAYGGHILGQLFQAPFWQLSASEGNELVGSQLLAPLAIAAFIFARELTIWFGAWVARSGARKTELNAEAQREYERTLEAGPTLSR
ncbi:ABC transporter [Microbacterium sp. C5A9]|uniref:ABC transporter n=1 Tax=Microbacterium sp. C5A9 TaxID=2736663 RepID=UPI001F52149B|nr:ABC transporter [Microbacterium sp. C5A9]MCI1019173.1 ABC transporter [Microbacterium sp. C5A9]